MISIIIVVLFVISLIVSMLTDDEGWLWSAVATGVVSVFAIVLLVGVYVEKVGEVQQFKAAKDTVLYLRDSPHSIERTAAVFKSAEYNAWLAQAQYWNSKWYFDWYYPDSVDELTPIR